MKKERLLQIMRLFITKNDYLSAQMIAKTLGVSVRTVYSDLDSSEFHVLLHGAYLDKKPNAGIKICATKTQLDKIYYELDTTKKELLSQSDFDDVQEVLFELLSTSSPMSMNDLTQLLYKSKNSIANILNQAQEYVEVYYCHITRKPNFGIQLHGNEQQIRKMFRCLIQDHIQKHNISVIFFLNDFFGENFITQICEHIRLSEQLMNTHYTDYDFNILSVKLSVSVYRLQLGFTIETAYIFDNALQEYYIATILKMKLEETFHFTMSRQDQCELAQAILATRKTVNHNGQPSFNDNVVDVFISKISNHLDVSLEDNEELKINLINHLRPAIRRIKHGSPSENPLLEHIRYKFTYVYIAVMITIDEIENQEHIYFDANELSFICLHIVAALNRKANHRIVHALLITNDGLTISTYIKSCLEKQFSELNIHTILNSEELHPNIVENYDLILNTTQLQTEPDRSIHINAILDENDYANIRHWLYYQELEYAMTKKDHLKDYVLMFHDDPIDKIDLLKKYCRYLVETGYVKEGFYDSVLERENKSTTSIGRGVAVPHGALSMVNKPVILIIHTKSKIIWDELDVDMIFLTALDGTHSSDYNYFFKQLFHIVEDEKQLDLLKHSTNMSDIEKLLLPDKRRKAQDEE
ncbi:BglG family transcription antiterminator [Amedibacillus sp. YH-ame10]